MGTNGIKVELADPAWRSPVQKQLDGLFVELAAFNERIAELVSHGHKSLAIDVLKAQALSIASQIDELRSLLAVPRHQLWRRGEDSYSQRLANQNIREQFEMELKAIEAVIDTGLPDRT